MLPAPPFAPTCSLAPLRGRARPDGGALIQFGKSPPGN